MKQSKKHNLLQQKHNHSINVLTIFLLNHRSLTKVCTNVKVKVVKVCFWSSYQEATILAIIFWHFLIIQHRSESPQVKRYLISTITNLVHELPHELANDSRLRILGNQQILKKCQIWMETQPSAQSSFQKSNFYNSCQKTRKIR